MHISLHHKKRLKDEKSTRHINDGKGEDFMKLTVHGKRNGFDQAYYIPNNTGTPIRYDGSTTGQRKKVLFIYFLDIIA